MKKYLIFLLLIVTIIAFPSKVEAKVVMQEKGIVVVSSDELIDDDLFIGAESIDMTGTVLGSVFAAAGTVDIKGKINGDLILGTGNGNISGTINGDLYVGGGDIKITNAIINGNVVVGAGNLSIDSSSKIGGSLIVGAGNVKNMASVGRNVLVGAGTIYLDNKVGKETRLGGGEIELGPHANLAGSLNYALGEDEGSYRQDPNATIAGSVNRYRPSAQTTKKMELAKNKFNRFEMMANKGIMLVEFLGMLLVGFVALKIFPKTSLNVAKKVTEELTTSLGIGFLISIAIVPILLILSITIIGLPLAGVLLLITWLSLCVAKLISSYALGRWIVAQYHWSKLGVYSTYAIGLLIFSLLWVVPVIGWISKIIFTWVGLGAIWSYSRSNLKNL